MTSDILTITVYKRKDFRDWLKKNGERLNRVAIILHKRHTGKPAPTHRELIEEAICFGWIDTTIKRIDHDTFLRNFAKRSQKSRWSNNTLKYAKQLIKEGKMTDQGMYFYKLGLKKPTHDHGIPKNPDMPLELKEILPKNRRAESNFNTFPPSTKRMLYRWILSGKLLKTRQDRARKVVRAAKLKTPNFLNPTKKENI